MQVLLEDVEAVRRVQVADDLADVFVVDELDEDAVLA